jgi:hypothetical protein
MPPTTRTTTPAAEAAPVNGRAPATLDDLVDVVTFPVRVSQGLLRDVAVTARNPEAVVYWGGLATLAVLGALEWPVAAAAGLGVAVAGATRRARS